MIFNIVPKFKNASTKGSSQTAHVNWVVLGIGSGVCPLLFTTHILLLLLL